MLSRTRLLFFACMLLPPVVASADAAHRPNIVFILADDLGYGDVGCFGGAAIETPHIDALAADGMRLTQFYSGSAVCTPTRISYLTGRYPLRYSCTTVWLEQGQFLPTSPNTLVRLLKDAGYRTLHVGKWNQGGMGEQELAARGAGATASPGPLEHGFDHYYTVVEGNPGIHWDIATAGRFYREGAAHMFRNDKPAEVSSAWLEDAVIDEALRLLDQQATRSEPFFLNYWSYSPHTPLEPARSPICRNIKIARQGDDLLYRSMVSDFDANVGRLVAKLKQLGMYDNTLIFFTSDNGPLFPGNPGKWSGGKADLHEGGIRMPSIAVWPGHIARHHVRLPRTHQRPVADRLPRDPNAGPRRGARRWPRFAAGPLGRQTPRAADAVLANGFVRLGHSTRGQTQALRHRGCPSWPLEVAGPKWPAGGSARSGR